MPEQDLYIYDDDAENFVPNPEITARESYGKDSDDIIGGTSVVLDYDQITDYGTYTPGGNGPETLYAPGTFYLISQDRHISMDGTIRVDVTVGVANDVPGKQYELRVTRA